jgi:hypothetical protein
MAKYDLATRRSQYFKLSSELVHLDTTQLLSMFETTEAQQGWGRNHTFDIGQAKVFVKLLPLTDLEFENMFSTKNLYDLPTYYNYGVWSAGFNVYRELIAHIKTTNWVLEGAIANFPLLYHYRIIPFVGERPAVDMEEHQRYVEYWNSNENIGRYVLDRAHANYELALFLEYIPYEIHTWLSQNPSKITRALEDLRQAITFLRKNGIVHFDAHFGNVLSDGERAYLADFGLVLDKRFALSPEEAQFLKQHAYYDYSAIFGSVGFMLYSMYDALSDDTKRTIMEKYGVADDMFAAEKVSILIKNIEEILAEGLLELDESYATILVKYRNLTVLFIDFFVSMRRNNQKNTKFPHAKLRRLLKETGFLSGSI